MSTKDWLCAGLIALVVTFAGGLDTSEAGPLRRVARGVGAVGRGVVRGGRAVGVFAYRRATFQRLRNRASEGGSELIGYGGSCADCSCANGVCR